jgi:hypothetical protein
MHNEIINYKLNGDNHALRFEELKRKDFNKQLGDGVSSVVLEMVHDETEKSFAVKVNLFLGI